LIREFKGDEKARIAADWAGAFPSLGVGPAAAGSPMLLRRAGPVLVGICLERRTDTTSYRPTAFVHFLGTAQPSIGLAGATVPLRPSGVEMIVRVGLHEREFGDAVARLRTAFPLSLDGDLKVTAVVQACLALAQREAMLWEPRMAIGLLELVVLVPKMVGNGDLAQIGLVEANRAIRAWGSDATVDLGPAMRELEVRARDPDALRRVVDAEVQRHRLSKVPTEDLQTG
jgi:hypothetical protein